MEERNTDFKELVRLMPEGWEAKASELGAFKRSRNSKRAEDLLLVNFLYLTSTPSFGGTAAIVQATEKITLKKTSVYERVGKSEKWLQWLAEHIYRNNGMLGKKPTWLEGKEVCLIDATDEAVHGSKEAHFRLHYCVELFSLAVQEMHLTKIETGEKLTNFEG